MIVVPQSSNETFTKVQMNEETKDDQIRELVDTLQEMWDQFAYPIKQKDGSIKLTHGGLSTLEWCEKILRKYLNEK